jgi:hypothetical protein
MLDVSNSGAVVSNPIRGIDVCLFYSAFLLSCVGRGLAIDQLLRIVFIHSFKS